MNSSVLFISSALSPLLNQEQLCRCSAKNRCFTLHVFSLLQVDLRHIDEVKGSNVVEIGVDLSEFYTSVEWDILEVPAVR